MLKSKTFKIENVTADTLRDTKRKFHFYNTVLYIKRKGKERSEIVFVTC